MTNRLKVWTLSLLTILLISACGQVAPASTGAAVTVAPPPTEAILPSASAAPTFIPSVGATALPPSPEPTVHAMPTSRGPDLEATDPATVSLASGGLQLIEFFRFT